MKEDKPSVNKDQIIRSYEDLVDYIRQNKEIRDYSLLKKAFEVLATEKEGEPSKTQAQQILSAVEIAGISVKEIGLGVTSVISIFIMFALKQGKITHDEIGKQFHEPVDSIVKGLATIIDFNERAIASQAENFRNLLLNLAGDVRVILIKIAEHIFHMRKMKFMSQENQIRLASDATYLYAPLAHRLGFYLIKSEMEDLSLKYTDRKIYDRIARNLAQKMQARKGFIQDFIKPIEKTLNDQHFNFEIKGRPKSIHSIWNKMVNKGVDFEDIYDLFAIRIIIDSEPVHEKADCWKVYSMVTDLYQPNPLRLRDWISVPKTNGYESLHTTVVGPDGRWVEVQIRTTRMNEIAEKGFAAHWKYKGLESDQGLDEWLGKIREVIETPEPDAKEFMDDFKLSLYSKEIFVFTPKGDLKKFPTGATVLDFAYDIHTDVGSACTGAKLNGKSVPIRHQLQNGDRVEIITSKNQTPKLDWLNFVITSKAKSKIKLKLNEAKAKSADSGKEVLLRRLKNWKIPFSDDIVRKLLKHYKLKTAQDLYCKVDNGEIELTQIKDVLQDTGQQEKVAPEPESIETKTVETFIKPDDYVVIDQKVANVDFKLAKCCNPIFGDDIFGFVTIGEGIKIHRLNCPNAAQLISKYGYRIVKAQWRNEVKEALFSVEIAVEGENDPNILNNISNVLSKDLKIHLQSISLDSSNEGLFKGRMKITVKDTSHLDALIARLSNIKGIYHVNRVERYSN